MDTYYDTRSRRLRLHALDFQGFICYTTTLLFANKRLQNLVPNPSLIAITVASYGGICTSLAATAILATKFKQPAFSLLKEEEECFYLTNVTFQKIN